MQLILLHSIPSPQWDSLHEMNQTGSLLIENPLKVDSDWVCATRGPTENHINPSFFLYFEAVVSKYASLIGLALLQIALFFPLIM